MTNSQGPINREKVRTMRAAGFTPREIAKALDLSTQRIYQIQNILDAIEEDKRTNGEAS